MLLCTVLSDSLLFQHHNNKVYYVLTQRVVALLQNYCFVSPKLKIFFVTVIIIKDIQADELSSMSGCSTAQSERAERVKQKNISIYEWNTNTH